MDAGPPRPGLASAEGFKEAEAGPGEKEREVEGGRAPGCRRAGDRDPSSTHFYPPHVNLPARAGREQMGHVP